MFEGVCYCVSSMQPTIALNTGHQIPLLGFGTWQLTGDTVYQAVKTAITTGYCHIDTADRYGNHKEVGQAIIDSSVARKDIFLTTKIWRESLQPDDALQALPRFLAELQTDYLDLLLIHWPNLQVDMNQTFTIMQE